MFIYYMCINMYILLLLAAYYRLKRTHDKDGLLGTISVMVFHIYTHARTVLEIF